jgi:hypothetical protein
MIFVWDSDWRIARLLQRAASDISSPAPSVTMGAPPTSGPSKALVLNLDRQVFEPIQVFSEVIRAVGPEVSGSGTTWAQLTNSWSSYNVPWNSFPGQNAIALMFGTAGTASVLWQNLTQPWSSYNVPWNSFPGGGKVYRFSANAANDNGRSIAYFYVPALLQVESNKVLLIDSWDFFFGIAQGFEIASITFEALRYPYGAPTPITATLVDLSDGRTFAVPKVLPNQNKYNRYIKVTFSGSSFNRGFAFDGGIIFVQVQERASL